MDGNRAASSLLAQAADAKIAALTSSVPPYPWALGILSAELLIEHTRCDIPPGILLWDINLGVNIYPTPYDSVGYARGTLYTS
jgi:hypothetical protein